MYTYRITWDETIPCWDEYYAPLDVMVSKTLRCTNDSIIQTVKNLLDNPNAYNITIEELIPSPSMVINTVDGIINTLIEGSK